MRVDVGTTVDIAGVTVSNGERTNSSGGGIYNDGTLTLTNSTVSGNLANGSGGGIRNGISVFNSAGTVKLSSSTITDNRADADDSGSGIGGGVRNASGATFTFKNTIIANNRGTSAGPDNCAGTLDSNGNNLMSDIDCTILNPNGVTEANSMLGPLQNNGGPTQTHAVLAGSPAIDGGNAGGCRDLSGALLLRDQRGATRHFDGDGIGGARCDIGAVEFGAGVGAPVDFDGNGTSDVVAFRVGAWLFYNFTTGLQSSGTWTGTSPGCIPVAMDYDGDGKTDFTQRCVGAWHFYNSNGSYNKGIWVGSVAGDLPVPADYDVTAPTMSWCLEAGRGYSTTLPRD